MKTVFFDVDTQIDFVFPAGALAVPDAGDIVENLSALTRFAASRGIQIISTADAHSEDDPEFQTWKPHCVVGTTGQQKITATLLPKAMTLTTEPRHYVADPEWGHASQVIVEKQKLDCFTNPNLRPLLESIRAERFVVYGVVSEYCVQCAAFGLLETGAKVQIVTDAIKSLSEPDGRAMLERFRAQGGIPATMAEVINA